jgi:hypothetical protein
MRKEKLLFMDWGGVGLGEEVFALAAVVAGLHSKQGSEVAKFYLRY